MIRVALLERIFSRIKKLPNGCWIWTGAKTNDYGVVRIGGRKGRTVLVHRIMWELGSGRKIPKNREPHHKCRTTSCIRPSHLKIVTHRENMLLDDTVSGINARKRTCIRGHAFTPNNTLLYTRIRNGLRLHERICRKCRQITMRKWRKS